MFYVFINVFIAIKQSENNTYIKHKKRTVSKAFFRYHLKAKKTRGVSQRVRKYLAKSLLGSKEIERFERNREHASTLSLLRTFLKSVNH